VQIIQSYQKVDIPGTRQGGINPPTALPVAIGNFLATTFAEESE
jgi:hypothetical protein